MRQKATGPVRAKGPRDFLLNFHHPKILLGAIVVKWHGKIMHETLDQVLMLVQVDQQIEGVVFLVRLVCPSVLPEEDWPPFPSGRAGCSTFMRPA